MADRIATLRAQDPELASCIDQELGRQRDSIELIASENFVSPAVMEAVGTVLTNKYAEGLPGHRYYGGCWAVDKVENLARDRVKKLFGAAYANVQPHSGAQANYAVETAFAKPGDTIMGMDLSNGGHLTHGSPVNFSGKLFNVVSYGLNPETERIDFDDVAAKAEAHKPKLIIAGASAYPRIIDFARFAQIAHDNGAILMVDMAHIAGIVAASLHPSPVPVADVTTSTTHKTLRGTRGGIILWNNPDYTKRINSSVFPGTQGGPLEHIIAGKAVAFGEALKPEFKTYIQNVLVNAKALGRGMESKGLRLVTGGTDNHLLLVDLTAAQNVSGRDAEQALESVGITVNKNTIPNEKRSPFVTSGIRVGSAAITTRGFDEAECERVGELIGMTVFAIEHDDQDALAPIKAEVAQMLAKHPLYPELG